jgi:sugar phosphate permease
MSTATSRVLVQRTYGKIIRRLLPFLSACYVLAYLDRLNIGFAKFQLASDLRLSDTAYGLGAGIFFLGYLLFEIPANLMIARVGARRWLARIMILWGIVSFATAFVQSVPVLYVARFLLGAAEAGFFPGVVFYLTLWFPDSRRAQVVSFLVTSIAVSGVIGGPLSGLILQHVSGAAGLHGWQWLFILEGAPSVLAGIAALFILDDTVNDAAWLTTAEKAVITQAVAAEARGKSATTTARVFADPRLWLLGLVYFCFCMGLYGIGFWLPQLLKNAGSGDALHTGLLTALPYAVAVPLMMGIARHSDASGNRRRHIALCGLGGTLGLTLSALHGDNLPIALLSLTLATVGVLSAFPLLWTLPTGYLTGPSAAAGIALVNSLGAIAGFVSPFLIGAVRDASHSTAGGIFTVAAFLALGGVLVGACPRPHVQAHTDAAA